MAKKNIVDIDYTVLQSVVRKLEDAQEKMKSVEVEKMPSLSKLECDEKINDAIDKLNIAINEVDKLIDTTVLHKMINKLTAWEQKDKTKTKNKNKNKKPSKKENKTNPSKNNNKSSGKNVKYKLVSNTNTTFKIGEVVKSIIPSIVPTIVVDPGILRPTIDIRTQELQNFEKYLQNGDLASAAKSYKSLKLLAFEDKAKELLDKYGYKVEEKDGEYVITKIVEENPSTITETPPANDQSSNTDGDVVAEETPNAETTTNNSTNEQKESVVNKTDNNNTNTTTNNNVNTNTNNSNHSNNSYSSNNSTNNNQTIVENTSTSIGGTDTTTQVETDNATSSSTPITEKPSNDIPTEKPKSNVISITDDSETTTTTKKSNGLGAAVPIGLGTIATGAAAVAGVRYVKNRHNNQEEYDENYDDENNDLDTDSEYVDAAQYDNGSSYMDDDYLGPTDNNGLSEDEYVDPEDLEEIDDFSDDSVLEELNSNY